MFLGARRVAHAAASLGFAAPGPVSAVSPGGGIARVLLALLVVLGAVFAAAWLSRRVHGAGAARSGGLEVLAQLPLGPRERAVLIRVAGQQLLLGVTNASVRTLLVLPEGAGNTQELAAASGATCTSALTRPSFKTLLMKSLGK